MNEPIRQFDVVVIGAGLSGLLAAATLVEQGARVFVVAKGGGYLHFTSGCIDVLGWEATGEPVADPLAGVDRLITGNPRHPYALAGRGALEEGVELVRRIMAESGAPYSGDLHRNLTLPTAIGSTRTTCVVPGSMAAGDLGDDRPMLIAGFRSFRDFYPPYLAANLRRVVPFPVRETYLDLPDLQGRRHLLSLDLARAFQERPFQQEVARAVRADLGGAGRVGFPAVLGLDREREVVEYLANAIGVPVFEIPTLPPSVRSIRLYHAIRRWLMRRGARIEIGFWVEGRLEGNRAVEVGVESAGRLTRYAAQAYVLATGGVGGGGIRAHPDGRLEESVFGLPVEGPEERTAWFNPQFLGPEPQPISLAGLRANGRLQPPDALGQPVENVFVTASNLLGWDPTREKSGEGVALATGRKAGQEAAAAAGAAAPSAAKAVPASR